MVIVAVVVSAAGAYFLLLEGTAAAAAPMDLLLVPLSLATPLPRPDTRGPALASSGDADFALWDAFPDFRALRLLVLGGSGSAATTFLVVCGLDVFTAMCARLGANRLASAPIAMLLRFFCRSEDGVPSSL